MREGLPDDVIVVTSRSFLGLAAQVGFVADPESAWSAIAAADPRANPAMNYQLTQRRPK